MSIRLFIRISLILNPDDIIQRHSMVLPGLIELKQQPFELFLIVIFGSITHI